MEDSRIHGSSKNENWHSQESFGAHGLAALVFETLVGGYNC